MEDFGKLCAGVLLFIGAPLISGFIIMKIWGWHIAPVFDLPVLDLLQATGISIFVVALKGLKKSEDKRPMPEFINHMLYLVLMQFVLLFMGWIVYLCK